MLNVTVVGVGDEESRTWKSTDLQGVGPMGMLADGPLPYSTVLFYCAVLSNLLLLSTESIYCCTRNSVSILKRRKKVMGGWD